MTTERYIAYLEDPILPEDPKKARELVLDQNHYEVLDGVLYHLEPDKTLWVILPEVDRRKIFDEAHRRSGQGLDQHTVTSARSRPCPLTVVGSTLV